MKLKIKNQKGEAKQDIELPKQFNEPVRADLIQRAFLAFQSHNFQPYGAYPRAGLRASSYLSKRRNSYRSTYGIGQSRTPRKVMSRRGTRLNYVGAFAPQTVSGRRAHPPKAEKIIAHKLNIKERRKAIRSALAATLNRDILAEKNYNTPEDYPFIIDDSFESIIKTKDLKSVMEILKINTPVERKIRAGKGKLRGRKYTRKKGPLLVVTKEDSLMKAAPNLNVEVVCVQNININLLAPGGVPGRITLFTESAIKKLKDENLFYASLKKLKPTKVEDKKILTEVKEKETKIPTAKKETKKVE